MWHLDKSGTELSGPDEAREELRRRALLAISAGLKNRCDIRNAAVRLRDQRGRILFEGTLAEAAAYVLDASTLPSKPVVVDAIAEARRLRVQAMLLRATAESLAGEMSKRYATLQHASASAASELRLARVLLEPRAFT